MRHSIRKSRIAAITAVLSVVAATMFVLAAPGAYGSTPSDDRADFHSGNATNCGSGQNGIGVGGVLAFASGTDPIDDGHVSGEVVDGTTVNVDVPVNATILAVVVKGGPAYNVYSTSSGTPPGNHVPPAEPQETEYISPFNGGTNIPTVSHWFICYTAGETPQTGSLIVTKDVIPAQDGSQPTSFTINVMCPEDGSHVDQALTLLPTNQGGTLTDSDAISGIPVGDECVVSEVQSGFTADVTIDQPGPITVSGADATVTNDFSSVEPVVVGPVEAVRPADPVAVSPAFTG